MSDIISSLVTGSTQNTPTVDCKLYIHGAGGKVYEPVVMDAIQWETYRKGAPSKLTFTVVKDDIINFPEGAPVELYVDGKGVFYGFVFTKSRSKEQQIQCTAYDQLRYFKNKNSYIYTNKTASEVLQMIISDFNLQAGEIADTGYKIAQRDEDNQTLFDIVLNALDLTYDNTNKIYVLYDDFGKLCLKDITTMQVNFLIDADTAEDFDYTTSIDEDTYNQIKITYENSETGKRELYISKDGTNINNWGVLQYYGKATKGVNYIALANMLLELKNRKTRSITIKNALGDVNIRAGCSCTINLNLGDVVINQLMECEKVVHYFTAYHHSMDVTVYENKSIRPTGVV